MIPLPIRFLTCGESGVSYLVAQQAKAVGVPLSGMCGSSGFNSERLPVRKWYGLNAHPWGMRDAVVANVKASEFVLAITDQPLREDVSLWDLGDLVGLSGQVSFEVSGQMFVVSLCGLEHLELWPREIVKRDAVEAVSDWIYYNGSSEVYIVGPQPSEVERFDDFKVQIEVFLGRVFGALKARYGSGVDLFRDNMSADRFAKKEDNSQQVGPIENGSIENGMRGDSATGLPVMVGGKLKQRVGGKTGKTRKTIEKPVSLAGKSKSLSASPVSSREIRKLFSMVGGKKRRG